MFDLSWSEYLLILVVSLVFLGPKELPVVLRTVGRWVAKARHIALSFENQLYNLDQGEEPIIFHSFNQKIVSHRDNLIQYQRVFDSNCLTIRYGRTWGKFCEKPSPKPWL